MFHTERLRGIGTSAILVGTYSIEKDKLTLFVSDDECYNFLIKGRQIIFDSSLPSEATPIDKGTVFKFVPEKP